MYWTCWPDKIMRAQMDGTEVVQILSGRDHPVGLAIDFDESRLYWSEYGAHQICSRALNGSKPWVEVLATSRPVGSSFGGWGVRYPWGIAVTDDYCVYWGNFHGNTLQRRENWGGNTTILLREQGHIQQLTTTKWNFPTSRANDCMGQNCGHNICVLTTSSFRCVR